MRIYFGRPRFGGVFCLPCLLGPNRRDLAEGAAGETVRDRADLRAGLLLVHRKGRESDAPVVAFREWLLAEVGL